MTIKLITRTEYQKGIEDRKKSPLHNGLYKLKEATRYPASTLRILRDLAKAKRFGESLYPFIGEENAKPWLTLQAKSLAYHAGKDLIPSIEALKFDGLSETEFARFLPKWRSEATRLIDEIENAEYQIRTYGVTEEYSLWKDGDSVFIEPCKTFLTIIHEALDLYGYMVPGQANNLINIHSLNSFNLCSRGPVFGDILKIG